MATDPVLTPPAPAQLEQPVAPKTTTQEDLTTASQRAINLIWETTQARIAVWVVLTTALTNAVVTVLCVWLGKEFTTSQTIGLTFLNLICFTVVSFYFSRTNHTKTGGVGDAPWQPASRDGST